MDSSTAASSSGATTTINYDSLSLEELLQNRDWKARQHGWIKLSTHLENNNSNYLDYLENNIRNAPLEPNAAALDSALQALQSFISHCPDKNLLLKLRSYTVIPLVEKGISSMRAGTKKASLSIVLDLYGLEGSPDTIITDLLSLSNTHKQPKVASNCLIALNECIKAYGLSNSSTSIIQAFLSSKTTIVNLFSHADKNVRSEISNLIIQISSSLSIKTLPPFLQQALSTIKPVQLKELNDSISIQVPTPPTLFRRGEVSSSFSPPLTSANVKGISITQDHMVIDSAPIISEKALDSYDFAEPFDLIPKIPSSVLGPKSTLEDANWKERKNALDELHSILVKYPRLESSFASSSYSSLVGALLKRIHLDSNVSVVTLSSNCLSLIMCGLRSHFASFRHETVPILLERMKERNKTVIESLRTSLDSLYYSFTLCSTDLLLDSAFNYQNISHKNPQVRSEHIGWISRIIEKNTKEEGSYGNNSLSKAIKGQLKPLLEKIFLTSVEDSSPDVRENAITLLSSLLKAIPGNSAQTITNSLIDRIDKGKLGKFLEKASAISVVPSSPVKAIAVKNTPTIPAPAPAPYVIPTLNPIISKSPTPNSIISRVEKLNIQDLLKPIRSSNDESLDLVAQRLGVNSLIEAFKGAGGGAWKGRVEFIESLERLSLPSEDLFRSIVGIELFKDGNVIVVSHGIQALSTSAASTTNCPLFLFSLICPLILEKISDSKLLLPSQKLFSNLIQKDALCIDLLITCLNDTFTTMKWSKNPKSLVDIMDFISSNNCSGRSSVLLEEGKFITTSLSHPQSSVRNAAIRVIVNSSLNFASIRSFLPSSISLVLLKNLEDEFDKKVVAFADNEDTSPPPPPPSSSASSSASLTTTLSTPTPTIKNNEMQIDHLTMDISSSLPSILTMMSEPNWKARKEGLESLHLLLKNRISISSSSLLHDLMTSLKGRLSDSNKILVTLTLEIVADLAKNIENSSKSPIFRVLLPTLVGTLSDAKLQVRQAALLALSSINNSGNNFASNAGFEEIKSMFTSNIASTFAAIIPNSESPHLRKEIMSFIGSLFSRTETTSPSPLSDDERNSLFSMILSCLSDRSSEVRKETHLTIEGLIRFIPQTQLLKYTENVRPDLISTVKLIEVSDSPHSLNTKNDTLTPLKERPSKVFSSSFSSFDKESCETLSDTIINELKSSHVLSSSFRDCIFSSSPLVALNDLLIELKGEFDERFLNHSMTIFKVLSVMLTYNGDSGSVKIRIVDCLSAMLSLLDEQNGRLEEKEAIIILVCWIKNSSSLKQRKRSPLVYRQFCRVYPASKIFSLILNLLKDDEIVDPSSIRNAHEELLALITRNGLMVLQPTKHIPILSQISSTESYNLLLKISTLMGPSVMEGVSKPLERPSSSPPLTIDDAEDALEDDPLFADNRMKRERPNVPQVFSLDYNGESFSTAAALTSINPSSLRSLSPQKFVTLEYTPTSDNNSNKKCPSTMIGKVIDDISHCNDRDCLLALQRLDEVINSPTIQGMDIVNGLFFALCIRLRESCTLRKEICFSNGQNGPLDGEVMALRGRLCRYVVNALLSLTTKHGSTLVDLKIISMVIGEILSLVSQDHHNSSEPEDPSFGLHLFGLGECESLMRNCNVLLVKFIESIPRNLCFLALVNLLENSLKHSSERFAEFVMKCLWKLTKQISVDMNPLEDQYSLLVGIDSFLVRLPPVEWKKRAVRKEPLEDLPLRTVKTIVNELCKLYGSSLLTGNQLDSDGYVYKYIKSLLPPPQDECQMDVFDGEIIEELSIDALKSSLKDICAKICTRPNTREGLLELYNLRKDQPSWSKEIEEYLLSLGTFFHRYIHRNLDQIQISSFNNENSNEKYRNRLAQIQSQMSSGLKINDAPSGLVGCLDVNNDLSCGEQGQYSPIRSRLESSDKKMTCSVNVNDNNSSSSTATVTATDSTILGLKERLARLKEGKSKLSY